MNDPYLNDDLDAALVAHFDRTLEDVRNLLWHDGFQIKITRRTDAEYRNGERLRICKQCGVMFVVRRPKMVHPYCSHICYTRYKVDHRK